jgi:hypothetical protein
MNLRSHLAEHPIRIVATLIVSAVAAMAQGPSLSASAPSAAAPKISAPESRPSLDPSVPALAPVAPEVEKETHSASLPMPDLVGKLPAEARKNPYPYEPSPDKEDCAICRAHLEKIYRAIQAYRRDHQDLPNWLSDLYPDYLFDATVFICPVTTKTGRLSPFGALDPKIYCSYLYEFSPAPMWAPVRMSVREWKRQQMSVVGSDVPIVRCLLHDPAQNLSFGGRIYDSGLQWEDNFVDVVRREDLNPHDAIVPSRSE